MRVVVVDDHPVFRKGLVALLSADGIEVVGEAENGLEAIAIVAETSPDVVLMDLGMPELGGIEATERIVAADPGIRVIVMGKSRQPAYRRLLGGSILQRLLREADGIDLVIVDV